MNKFFGKIGFVFDNIETAPGVWEPVTVEKDYYVDIIANIRRMDNTTNVNDYLDLSNRFSIISDIYANENFYAIRYITYKNSKWKVSSIEIQYPRLILTVGGLYHYGK